MTRCPELLGEIGSSPKTLPFCDKLGQLRAARGVTERSRYSVLKECQPMSVRLDGWRVVYVAGFMAGAAALFGPSTSAAQSAPAPAQVTYTKDIAPILQRSCENCHRPMASRRCH